jgi:hypothetical protein
MMAGLRIEALDAGFKVICTRRRKACAVGVPQGRASSTIISTTLMDACAIARVVAHLEKGENP